MSLRVTTYNCFSLRRRVDIIRELLNNCDILLLQETLLSSCQLDITDKLNNNFSSAHVPSFEPYLTGAEGRLSGGLSIFWKKGINVNVNPVFYNDNLMGLKISSSDINYLLLNVYMPSDDRTDDSLIKFKNICAQISSNLSIDTESESIHKVIIAGDFNADPSKGRFWHELERLINSLCFNCADLSLPNDSFTYLSPAHNTTSWLDHILASDLSIIENIEIEYGKSFYDHFPVSFDILFPADIEFTISNSSCIDIKDFIIWDKLTKTEREMYHNNIQSNLENYFNEALFCTITNCDSHAHKSKLNDAYNFLINCLKSNSSNFTIQGREKTFKPIPGWNSECKQYHSVVREQFLLWKTGGKIRSGPLYERMKSSRAAFQSALKQCKKNEDQIRKNNLTTSFAFKTRKEFWKDVKNIKSNRTVIMNRIDQASNSKDIVDVFNNKFKKIFDDKNCQSVPENYLSSISKLNLSTNKCKKIRNFNAVQAINSINDCLGVDGLHSNHFKFAAKPISNFLSRLFSSFLIPWSYA